MRLSIQLDCCIKKIVSIFSFLIAAVLFFSCNGQKTTAVSKGIPFSSIEFSEKKILSHAEQFSMKSSEGFTLVEINGENPILVIESGCAVPVGIPENYVVLKKPIENTYIVSSSVMDFFVKLDILDCVKFSGLKKENWYIEEAVERMESGKMLYAGKYSAPDFELLYKNKVDASIQNTMIYHKPEVKEKLSQLGIPVVVEKSSYEKNPLGKLEWIKLYGFLYGKEKEAENFFDQKIKEFSKLSHNEHTDKKIAFFYITSSGSINVRKPQDYISKMIDMSGARYFLEDVSINDENHVSSLNMQSEEFYEKARDCDFLIYNSTIDGTIKDKKMLLKKYPLLKDFKAYKEDNIFVSEKLLFQETTGSVDFMKDLNGLLHGKSEGLCYLKKIK